MTETEKRIVIAEACGWTGIHDARNYGRGINGLPPGHVGDLNAYASRKDIPNYFTDLSAIHEAEKICLTEWKHRTTFMLLLSDGHERDAECMWNRIHSTAAERAEALGLTLNLWTPS